VAADREEGHRVVGAVENLVRAVLAERAMEHLAFVELAGAVRGAHGRASVDHDDELLIAEVVVVRIRRLTRWQLPQARADQLAADLGADAGSSGAKAGWPLVILEAGW
jgi:hypothetical protein